mgnify:CR=1 FL=1
MIGIGTQKISALSVGTAKITRGLVGETIVFESKPAYGLPAGYTKVEYIQNGTSGTKSYMPYINMPITAKKTATKFEIKFLSQQSVPANSNKFYAVYGYNVPTSTQKVSRNTFGIYNGKVCYQYALTLTELVDYTANTIFDAVFDTGTRTIQVNGVSKKVTIGMNWRTTNNLLFGSKNTAASVIPDDYFPQSTRIYTFKMWDADGNLAFELVPCIDPSGVAGMYDVVEGVFYKNENPSTNAANKFIAGPVVS